MKYVFMSKLEVVPYEIKGLNLKQPMPKSRRRFQGMVVSFFLAVLDRKFPQHRTLIIQRPPSEGASIRDQSPAQISIVNSVWTNHS